MTANVITYRGRSAARDVGKALGFPAEALEKLSSLVATWGWHDPDDTAQRQFQQAGFDLKDPRIQKYLSLYVAAQNLPRHLGQHSGGMVICQGQLDSVVPLEPATMPGRVVIEWDKDDCADMGIDQSRSAGAGDDGGAGGIARADPRALPRRGRSGASAAGRPESLRSAAEGRHHRDVSGGEPRADVVPAAPQAQKVLRHRGAGGHHPSRPHRGQDAASLSEPAAGI